MRLNLLLIYVFILSIFVPNSLRLFAESSPKDILSLHQTSQAFNAVAKKGQSAVVNISAIQKTASFSNNPFLNDPFFRQLYGIPQEQQREGLGSGVLVSEEGHILTNHHVIQHADQIRITLNDGREYDANMIGKDKKTDLALLQIIGDDLPSIRFGNSDALQVGDWAIAVGNPFGLQGTVTAGIISATGRAGVLDAENYADFIQTDAAINPGNSGGALLNIHGELIGINTAIFSQSGGYMGIGFAVPVNMAKRVMEDLIAFGSVRRGYFGVSIKQIDDSLMTEFNLKSREGAFVVSVDKGSAAEKAGIQANDVIISVSDKKITDYLGLRSRIADIRFDETHSVTVIRKGRKKRLTFMLESSQNTTENTVQDNDFDKLGLIVASNSSEWIKKYGLRIDTGVVITDVLQGSLGDYHRFQPGHVITEMNGYPVDSIQTYKQLLAQSDVFLMTVNVNGYHYQLYIKNR